MIDKSSPIIIGKLWRLTVSPNVVLKKKWESKTSDVFDEIFAIGIILIFLVAHLTNVEINPMADVLMIIEINK